MHNKLTAIAAILPLTLAACSTQSGSSGPADAATAAAKSRQRSPADHVDNQQPVDLRYFDTTDSRTFIVEYTAKVPKVPPGTKTLRVWVPVPQDSSVQKIDDLGFEPKPTLHTEPKYGNRLAYLEITDPGTAWEGKMRFTCTRTGIKAKLDQLATDGKDPAGSYDVFRKADALVLVDDEIKALAADVTKGKSGTLAKAEAIYEYVVGQMTYDKAHEGWGLGSTKHACEVGKGNCTDFHALFNSLCRAEGIASGFEIGLYPPYERKSDEKLGGYHCWAFFRVPGKTWVPVDCSEADRFPQRADFFFGGHTSNRVTLSTGRDIDLVPKQAGPAVNYILNPYAEADGKPVATDKSWTCRDVDA